ncbi:MAG: hypothetical protein AB7K36_21695 [Chloroflexota bacterium]
MPGTIGAGALMSPWLGMWDLVWQSPETWPILAGMVIGLTAAGATLTVLGRRRQEAAPAVVIARVHRQPQAPRVRSRHQRRRRVA